MKYFLLTLFISVCVISCKPTETKKDAPISPNEQKLKIEYIAHASFKLTYDDHTLLLDPYADTTWIGYYFPRDIEADAIFSTHPHYDHDGGIFRNLEPYWQGQIPFYQDPGNYIEQSFKIEGIKGKHCDPYGKEFGQKNTIFIFEVADMRIVHWGDNGPLNDTLLAHLSDIDILLLPIDDTFHILKEEETKEVIAAIAPKIVVPMHYRINELESNAEHPVNLGGIDDYFTNRMNVIWLESNSVQLSKSDLPDQLKYMVFKHSDAVYN